MKIKFLLALLVLSSCLQTNETNKKTETRNSYFDYGTTTIEHDGCEYVIWSATEKGGITHKGNCKYCEQRKLNTYE